MRHLMGLVVAGGLLLGVAGNSDAQFSLSIGNGGYGYGSNYYSSGYNGYLAGPGVIGATNYGGYPGYAPIYSPSYAYSSGYAGYAPGYRTYAGGVPARYYGASGYGGYGYGYGYGSRGGFHPLQGIGRRFR